ncbi:MAG: SlyX family protein [Congregibacter sp.]
MSSIENDADFIALQAELAFQAETVDNLNEALARQQQDLLEMRRQLAVVAQQLKSLRESAAGDGPAASVDEKPPHY